MFLAGPSSEPHKGKYLGAWNHPTTPTGLVLGLQTNLALARSSGWILERWGWIKLESLAPRSTGSQGLRAPTADGQQCASLSLSLLPGTPSQPLPGHHLRSKALQQIKNHSYSMDNKDSIFCWKHCSKLTKLEHWKQRLDVLLPF